MASEGKPQEDKLVSQLIPDPTQGPPDAVALSGYLGRSPQSADKGKPTVWRLYQTHSLDSYVEIPEDEILHTQKLPDDRGSIVWVPKSLHLNYVHVHSGQVQAELLGSGPIAQAGAAAGTPSLSPGAPVSLATVCSTVTCPSVQGCVSHTPCPTVTVICPTRTGVCITVTPSSCAVCATPSATRSHCFVCPPLSTAPSECTICPPPSGVVSHCNICPTPSVIPSHCNICPTPTATPGHYNVRPMPAAARPEYIHGSWIDACGSQIEETCHQTSVLTAICINPLSRLICPKE